MDLLASYDDEHDSSTSTSPRETKVPAKSIGGSMLESEWLSFESMIAPGGPSDDVTKNSYLVDGVVAYPGMKSAQKLSSSEAELAPVVQSSASSDSEDDTNVVVEAPTVPEVVPEVPVLEMMVPKLLEDDDAFLKLRKQVKERDHSSCSESSSSESGASSRSGSPVKRSPSPPHLSPVNSVKSHGSDPPDLIQSDIVPTTDTHTDKNKEEVVTNTSKDDKKSSSHSKERKRSRSRKRSHRDRSRSKHRDHKSKSKRRRSRSRSKDRKHRHSSRDRHRHKDRKSRSDRDRKRSRSKDRKGSKDRKRSKSRDRKDSKSRDLKDSKSRDRKDSKSDSHGKKRSRSRSRDRKDKKRDGKRSRSKEIRKSRDSKRERSKDRKKHRSRDRRSSSRSKKSHRSRSRDRHTSRSRSRERLRSRSPMFGRKLTFKEQMRKELLSASKKALLENVEVALPLKRPGEALKPSDLLKGVTITSGDSTVTPQMALIQTMAAMQKRAQEITGVEVPKYYNPAAVNPLKYAEQVQKRKLLWGKKDDDKQKAKDGQIETQWKSAFITDDGKTASKFRKLMGMKEGEGEEVSSGNEEMEKLSEEQKRKQDELFQKLDEEYQFARITTHTQRGVGLGFSSQIYDPNHPPTNHTVTANPPP